MITENKYLKEKILILERRLETVSNTILSKLLKYRVLPMYKDEHIIEIVKIWKCCRIKSV